MPDGSEFQEDKTKTINREALDHLEEIQFQSLLLSDWIKWKKYPYDFLNSIAAFYKNQKKYEKSSEYLEKTIKICKDKNQKVWLSDAYYQQGDILKEKKEYDQALVYLNQALKLEMQIVQNGFTPYDNPINILIKI